MNESFRFCNNSAILIRVLEFPVTLVWTETHIFMYTSPCILKRKIIINLLNSNLANLKVRSLFESVSKYTFGNPFIKSNV